MVSYASHDWSTSGDSSEGARCKFIRIPPGSERGSAAIFLAPLLGRRARPPILLSAACAHAERHSVSERLSFAKKSQHCKPTNLFDNVSFASVGMVSGTVNRGSSPCESESSAVGGCRLTEARPMNEIRTQSSCESTALVFSRAALIENCLSRSRSSS